MRDLATVPIYCRMVGEYPVDGGVPGLEPGDMYWFIHQPGKCYVRWTNCDGRHLVVVLPNGHHWDIDSRANNCTLPRDTVHRCWVRAGTPPSVSVGKSGGQTCGAGAGSIQSGQFHGFLDEGWVVLQRGTHPRTPPAPRPLALHVSQALQEEDSKLADETAPTPAATPAPAPVETTAPAPTPATKDDAKAKVLETLRHPEAHKDHNALFHRLAEDLEHLFRHL